ncbi:PA14 domain protein [Theileria parva strain Muguga]|uniref:PA14 domain protein n=1 Tax=Theileria parva strain Muguga TaxID=333668 RepID=UPI001C61EB05|nr:PA14 domain protein [Theileria parva strain Muguga]EAN33261.2 PA14 domain protein [Theileria parva strain Muguga]
MYFVKIWAFAIFSKSVWCFFTSPDFTPKNEVPLPKDFTIQSVDDYDQSELKKLTEYRQRHRKTLDGALCAAAFVRNGNTFTDCTTTEAPDGSVGREWCYLEVQLIGTGARDWDFCAGVIDYDALRYKASSLMELRRMELEQAYRSLVREERRVDSTLSKYEEVCGSGEQDYESDILRLETSLKGVDRAIAQLKANSSSLLSLTNSLDSLEDERDLLTKSALHNRKNCSVVRGYLDQSKPDGLRASYYNNPYFRGVPSGFIDHEDVNLMWEDFVPVFGVPHDSFSVRIEGFLRIPSTDVYTFYVRSDCNVRLFLDEEVIASQGFDPESDRGGPVVTQPINGRPTMNVFVKSNSFHLIGGKRYPITVEYSHQKVLKYYNSNIARLALSWSSTSFPEQIITSEHFFKGSGQNSDISISGLEGQYYTLSMLENGAQAFKGVSNFVIADVPGKFIGARMITMHTKPTEQLVSFEVSNHSLVYVAIPTLSNTHPKDEDGVSFEKTFDVLSVYGVGDNCGAAFTQIEFTIYWKKFQAGNVKLLLPDDTSSIIFILPAITSGLCKGDVSIISYTPSDKCVASSSSNELSGCVAGFGNGMPSEVGWITAKDKLAGEFLRREFPKMVELRYFHFLPRGALRASEVSFRFSDGSEEDFAITDELRYEFRTPVMVQWARIEIKAVEQLEGTENTTGGVFTLFGVICEGIRPVKEKQIDTVDIAFCSGNCDPSNALIIDSGHTKSSHGNLYYGWNTKANPIQCTDNIDTATANNKGFKLKDNKWSLEVPYHGVFRIKVKLGALCKDLKEVSLTINGYEVLGSENLEKNSTVTYVGIINMEKVGRIELGSETEGLGLLSFNLSSTLNEI